MNQKNLEYLGLSEKEAKVYMALLKVEKMQATVLARKLSIKQPTIYVILDSLLSKKLVKEVTVGKRAFYASESPEVLLAISEKELADSQFKNKKAEEIVAELKTINKEDGEKPVVRFYEGKEAMKKSIDEYVATEKFSEGLDYGIYSYDLLPKIFDKRFLSEIENKRIENNIRFRAIYSGSDKVISKSNSNQELIKIDQGKFPINCDISIFNDEIRFHTAVKEGVAPYGVVIKNKEIATTLKSIIDYLFEMKKNI